MRTINLIVIHCSATREDRTFTERDLEAAHRLRGMDGIGYHFYIRRNGDIKSTRPLEKAGAHGVIFGYCLCHYLGLEGQASIPVVKK